ncbi:Trichome differentiation protein GL1 [Entamoeba marina]
MDNKSNNSKTPKKSQENKKPKLRWTELEDQLLKKKVKEFGKENWVFVASMLPNRNPKQCRWRYFNYLVDDINSSPFSFEEDVLLLKKRSEFGNSWFEIAKYFDGRTPKMIKDRYFKHLKGNNDSSTDDDNDNDSNDPHYPLDPITQLAPFTDKEEVTQAAQE